MDLPPIAGSGRGGVPVVPSAGGRVRTTQTEPVYAVSKGVERNTLAGQATTFDTGTGRESIVSFNARLAEIPLKMNGAPIYYSNVVDVPASLSKAPGNILKELVEHHIPSLANLADGTYSLGINQLTADANGTLVYYNTPRVDRVIMATQAQESGSDTAQMPDPTLARQINAETEAAFADLRLSPALKNGKPVIAYVPLYARAGNYLIRVRGGKGSAALIKY